MKSLAWKTADWPAMQVDEVKNIMVDNIEKVLERGEKIELLVDKTDNLRFQVLHLFSSSTSSAPGHLRTLSISSL